MRIYSLHILVVLKIKKTKQKSFIIKVITPNGKEKHYAYDACNRLLEERTIDKPNGIDRVVFYSYDKAGNVIERETGGRKEARASYQKEKYAYNYEDQAIEKTNVWGGRYTYFYDKNQQVIEVREPEQEQGTRYRYDNRGNVVEVRDALGIQFFKMPKMDAKKQETFS